MVRMREGSGACVGALLVYTAVLFGCADAGTTPTRDAAPQPEAGPVDSGLESGGDDDGSVAMPEQPPAGAMVALPEGMVQGDLDGDAAIRFLKIPFAKPPVGDLRWKAPAEPDPWEGVRHETEFASPCPQAMSQQSPESTNEDCLYLNVWRPSAETQGAPVMLWIHGGGNTTGSAADTVPTTGSELWYDGRVFAERHGIVVVTFNYRLGVFGFFSHPELAEEGSPRGNQGLFDQVMVMEWVRDNIEAFGGDPNNVTIFGESAGSADVCLHTVSPLSRGLFHRAVSQSGGCASRAQGDQAAIDTITAEFATEKGCEGEDVLACLRDKPAEELVDLMPQDRAMGMLGERLFGINLDGQFLPQPPAAYFESGDVAQVPYILGSNTEEGFLYVALAAEAELPANDEEYLALIREEYSEAFAEELAEMYAVSKFDGSYRVAVGRLRGDSGLVCGTHDAARRAVSAGLEVYMYNFNVPWAIAGGALGPTHAAEISHVFGTPHLPMPDADSEAVALAMNTFWATFAKTGDPNYEGAPVTWPRFMPDANDDDQRVQFDANFEILQSFRKEECALWRQIYAAE